MPSKFNFGGIARKVKTAERRFLFKGIRAAQKEFRNNFNQEKNSETGQSWDMVLRGYPPPILDVSGNLKAQTLSVQNIRIVGSLGILKIDPIDERGRGYASYHQEGTDEMAERKFVTQSQELDAEQRKILIQELDRTFL